MDAHEATTIVLSKIQKIDPENASKIMGYLLIKDLLTEKDLIRLAFGSETLMQNIVLKAKTQMGLSSNTSSAPMSPSNLFNSIPRLSNPSASNTHLLSQSSPRITPRGNEYDVSKNPFSGYASNTSFSPPNSNPLHPFENTHMGSLNFQSFPLPNGGSSNTTRGSSLNAGDFVEEQPFNEYFSFLTDSVRSSGDFGDISYGLDNNGDNHLHRRSYSESDVCYGSEDGSSGGINGGFRPCLYFARGFCKNGSNCKFVHGGGGVCDDFDGGGSCVSSWGGGSGSPSGFDPEEMMRLKVAHQQRLASIAAAVAGSSQFMPGTSPVSQHKYMNFLLQQRNEAQRLRMMMGDESYKFGRYQLDRNEFLAMGLAEKANSASRQIYLTFPADSTFKDDDVAGYFSSFGLVQDVRIPYQQKRMFGFVTFVYPETVKLILAKGNPHFICNSRVLVKPYKEKGKVPEKRQQLQQQHFERGEFSPSSSNLLVDSMEPFDQLGARVFHNSHEMMLRRKLEEQADLQQAIELQSRRLINLQLPDLKNNSIHHRSLSVGSPISLPVHQLSRMHHENVLPSDVSEECWGTPPGTFSSNTSANEQQLQGQLNDAKSTLNGITSEGKDHKSNAEVNENQESLEHILPDSLFASPTKSAADHPRDFSKSADPNDGAVSSNCNDDKPQQAGVSSSDSSPQFSLFPVYNKDKYDQQYVVERVEAKYKGNDPVDV